MGDNEELKLVSLEQIKAANEEVQNSFLCTRTPLLEQVQSRFHEGTPVELYLKLENTQVTGSFKVKGLANQLAHLPKAVRDGEKEVITMSAGNYGKALCYAAHKLGIKARVLTPETAPMDRTIIMESYGATVERVPSSELMQTVDRYVRELGLHFLHPFDDLDIIAGYGSVGLEILADLPDPDIIAVCCGGGGLVAGIAAAVKLSGKADTRIYCVEPETANAMHLSFQNGEAAQLPNSHSVASGLSPPFAGRKTYNHCKHFTEGVLLVSDDELVRATKHLYERGLVVEPAGAAAFAALMFNKIPDVIGKRVVIVLTGGNVSPQQMYELWKEY
ncbi:putative serine racemase [Apostichopus japonicus]|uniref:L-serine deaminase n=1 Tax=Stichopus japonicus TaxID=307972 RepID=A0A2G8KKS5_STIJA|nr:putative serine racemase [Apostichopus japonicus]